MSFANRIKALRGLETQKAFAERLGITPQAVLNYEKYGRSPKGRYLTNICQKLGVREQWLLTGEGPMRSDADRKEGETCDTVAGERGTLITQPIEKTQFQLDKTCDMSQVPPSSIRKNMELQERLLAAQERLLSLTEQNAELRLQLQARDTRIRDLEKENAQLREAQKGNTYPGAGVAGSAS